MTAHQQALEVAVGTFVAELVHSGVRHVCACPGSRSTPLAIRFAREAGIKLWMHLDERSAAYFALGLARALREPVGILATSGTAAANFFPAVIEARLNRVPLVVLTADRPHELRDVGAPQTIDQVRLYGERAKWFFDLPEPEATTEQIRLLRMLAARAVGTAVAEPAGPVHLNWPFREPLMPEPQARATDDRAAVTVRSGRLAPSSELIDSMSAEFAALPRGLIVCGPQDDPDLPEVVARLARTLGYPILADPLSGMRCGPHDRSLVVDAYDAFLRDPSTVDHLEPQVVLRIGAPPTSKSLLLYLQRYSSARHIVVDPCGWREPTGLASDMLHVDPKLMCAALADAMTPQPTTGWADRWLTVDGATRRAIVRHLQSDDSLSETRLFSELMTLLPEGAVLYAGNSMPVRDLDTFLAGSEVGLRCLSNRGANGIDGVVSSALGASAARVGPVVLVIGDISFYHDLNGLLAARQHDLDLLVVVVNNDGGGIFSFLPQADGAANEFELLFGTPHGLDFQPFVAGYGGQFTRVEGWSGFRRAVCEGLEHGGLQVVEVPTDRARNVVQHRQIWRAVGEALTKVAAPAAAG